MDNSNTPIVDSWDELEHAIITCRKCPRLVAWREEVARTKRRAYRDADYWGKPIPGFGDPDARVLILGLAPGAHGSNRTGRMFTGDSSGETLFGALYRTGFANQPTAHGRNDGLKLSDVFITAVGRCAPRDRTPPPAGGHRSAGAGRLRWLSEASQRDRPRRTQDEVRARDGRCHPRSHPQNGSLLSSQSPEHSDWKTDYRDVRQHLCRAPEPSGIGASRRRNLSSLANGL